MSGRGGGGSRVRMAGGHAGRLLEQSDGDRLLPRSDRGWQRRDQRGVPAALGNNPYSACWGVGDVGQKVSEGEH